MHVRVHTHAAPAGGASQLAGSILAQRLGPCTATADAQRSPGNDNRGKSCVGDTEKTECPKADQNAKAEAKKG